MYFYVSDLLPLLITKGKTILRLLYILINILLININYINAYSTSSSVEAFFTKLSCLVDDLLVLLRLLTLDLNIPINQPYYSSGNHLKYAIQKLTNNQPRGKGNSLQVANTVIVLQLILWLLKMISSSYPQHSERFDRLIQTITTYISNIHDLKFNYRSKTKSRQSVKVDVKQCIGNFTLHVSEILNTLLFHNF